MKLRSSTIVITKLYLLTQVIGVIFFSFLIKNTYAYSNNMEASLVVGQTNFTSTSANQGGAAGANTVNGPRGVATCNGMLFVADRANNRVLIFNTFPNENNASADVVVGQSSFSGVSANQGGTVNANTLSVPSSVACAGTKLIIGDAGNHRVLIFNTIPVANNTSADVVVGQSNFTSNSFNQGGACAANTLRSFTELNVTTDGDRLVIGDAGNHRVLIWDDIPTTNNASANVVVGQSSFTACTANQGGTAAANTLQQPRYPLADGTRLFIGDAGNHRVLIFNTIPVSNNASADVVVGQANFTSISANQGGTVGSNTLFFPNSLVRDGDLLIIGDQSNNRALVFNSVPTTNNTSADIVIGQADFISNSQNQGGTAMANTLSNTYSRAVYEQKLVIADLQNNRILIFDSQPPTGSITIDGPSVVDDPDVILTLTAEDFFDSESQLEMMISNQADLNDGIWESFATSKSWTLTAGDGYKTVYAKFRDHLSNESEIYNSNQVLLDTSSSPIPTPSSTTTPFLDGSGGYIPPSPSGPDVSSSLTPTVTPISSLGVDVPTLQPTTKEFEDPNRLIKGDTQSSRIAKVVKYIVCFGSLFLLLVLFILFKKNKSEEDNKGKVIVNSKI